MADRGLRRRLPVWPSVRVKRLAGRRVGERVLRNGADGADGASERQSWVEVRKATGRADPVIVLVRLQYYLFAARRKHRFRCFGRKTLLA